MLKADVFKTRQIPQLYYTTKEISFYAADAKCKSLTSPLIQFTVAMITASLL